MYLSVLGEKQKESFMDLAYQLSMADTVFSDEEQMVMQGYLGELGIDYDYVANAKSLDAIIGQLLTNGCEESEKKVMVFELVCLAMSDDDYDDRERALIERLSVSFGFPSDFCDKCEAALKAYLEAQDNLTSLVLY